MNTEAINIVFRDQIIEGAHQCLKHDHALGSLVIGHKGLERVEVPLGNDLRVNKGIALTLEKAVSL